MKCCECMLLVGEEGRTAYNWITCVCVCVSCGWEEGEGADRERGMGWRTVLSKGRFNSDTSRLYFTSRPKRLFSLRKALNLLPDKRHKGERTNISYLTEIGKEGRGRGVCGSGEMATQQQGWQTCATLSPSLKRVPIASSFVTSPP